MNQHDIGIVGIIGIILLAFASIGFCKGLIRTLLATLCLVIAVYVAIWGQEHAHELTGSLIKNPGPWLSWSIGLITGIIAFLICRYLLHFLVDPFNSSKTGRHIGFGFPAAVITFCMGAAFIWLLCSGIRYGGSIAELEDVQHKILKETEKEDQPSAHARLHRYTTPVLIGAKDMLDNSPIGKWHQSTDPFHSPERIPLCKILILYHLSPSRQPMLKIDVLKALLNDATFLKLAHQKQIKEAVSSRQLSRLFSSKPVGEALVNREFLLMLQKITSKDLSPLLSR